MKVKPIARLQMPELLLSLIDFCHRFSSIVTPYGNGATVLRLIRTIPTINLFWANI